MRSPLPQSDRSALNGSWTKASHPASSTHPTGSPPDARLESASSRFRSKTAALRLLPTFPPSTSSSTLILDSPLRTRGLSRSSSPSPPLSSKVGSRCSVPSPILVPNVDRSFAAAHQHHRTTPTFQPVHQRSRTRADFRDHSPRARRCRAGSGPAIRRRRSALTKKRTTSTIGVMQHPTSRTNFDHSPCYRDGLHPPTKLGRQWCRTHGPASRSRGYGQPVAVASPPQTQQDDTGPAEVRRRRAEAAKHYQPSRVRLLLVAQAPPDADDRYFYFLDVAQEHVPSLVDSW